MVNAIAGLLLGTIFGMILGALAAENRYLKLISRIDKIMGDGAGKRDDGKS